MSEVSIYLVALDEITDIQYICDVKNIDTAEQIIAFLNKINSSRFDFTYGNVLEDTESIIARVDSVRKFVDVVVHILLTDLGIAI